MIEKINLECIEACFAATIVQSGDQKYLSLTKTSALFDTLKLFIRIAIQIHCLEEKTYLRLIPHLGETGKMLGGWIRKSSNPISNSKS